MDPTSESALRQWRDRGWVSFDSLLPGPVAEALPRWVDAISRPVCQPGERRLHFFEQTGNGPALCRTERYLDDHPEVRDLVTCGAVAETAAVLLGEPAAVYGATIRRR